MATYTWTHGGTPETIINTAPSGISVGGAAAADFSAGVTAWNGTADENGTTGTVNIPLDPGSGTIASITIAFWLEDDGSIPADAVLETLSIDFDWSIVNGPMAPGNATSAFNSTCDGTDDPQGEGSSTGSYSATDDVLNLIGDQTKATFFAVFGDGGIAPVAVIWNAIDTGGFSAHDRSLTMSNLVVTLVTTGAVVTDVDPTHGDAAGNTVVTLGGTGFTGAASVLFGATAATSFTVDSDTQITAISPEHAVGAVTITVS